MRLSECTARLWNIAGRDQQKPELELVSVAVCDLIAALFDFAPFFVRRRI